MEFDSNGGLGKRKNRSPESRGYGGGLVSGRARERGVALKARLQSPSIFHSAASIAPFTNSLFFTNAWVRNYSGEKYIYLSCGVGKSGRFLNEQSLNKWYCTVRGRTWTEAYKTDRRCIWKGLSFNPLEWLASKFPLQYYPGIKDDSHENRGNDHQLRKLLIFSTNSSSQYHRECMEDNKENMRTDLKG